MDAQKYKDQLKEVRSEITKQQYQLEKRQDKLEIIADDVATCKLDLLNAGFVEVNILILCSEIAAILRAMSF